MSAKESEGEAPKKVSADDRRLSPRVLVDLEVDYRSEDTFLFAYITDMSALGIFVRTSTPEPEGTLLHLRFTPPGEDAPLAVEGRVVWLNPYRPGDINNINPGMGIKFVNLDDEVKQRLVNLVKKIAYLDGQEPAAAAEDADRDTGEHKSPAAYSSIN